MKQKMVNALADATKESNKAFSQISSLIEEVDESIGNGLAMLAQALRNKPQRPMPVNGNFYQSSPSQASMYQAHQQSHFQMQYPPSNFIPTPSNSSFSSQNEEIENL